MVERFGPCPGSSHPTPGRIAHGGYIKTIGDSISRNPRLIIGEYIHYKMPGLTRNTSEEKSDVIVVGGGPAGTYCALRLAAAGVSVTLLEALDDIEDAPKAVTHMPTMFAEYKKAGILENLVKASGKHTGVVAFRRSDNEEKTIIECIPPMPGRPGPVVVAQRDFTIILLGELAKYPTAKVLMGHRVQEMETEGEGVTVKVKTTQGEEKTFTASYLVGADGGSSYVRKTCGLKFEGVSLPYKLVAADVFYPFENFGEQMPLSPFTKSSH